jgi:CBS domain-containing protein
MGQSHEARELDALQFHELTAADVMGRVIQSAHQRTKGDVMASMMIEGFGGVPIVDDGHRLVGLVTEFDLLAALDNGKRLDDLTAHDVMTCDPMSVTPHTDVRTVMHVLQTNHFIRVPVVDGEGKLVGIVARRDVLRGYLSSKAE